MLFQFLNQLGPFFLMNYLIAKNGFDIEIFGKIMRVNI